jgi:hypothetical protein
MAPQFPLRQDRGSFQFFVEPDNTSLKQKFQLFDPLINLNFELSYTLLRAATVHSKL